jgi:hypothetical protein
MKKGAIVHSYFVNDKKPFRQVSHIPDLISTEFEPGFPTRFFAAEMKAIAVNATTPRSPPLGIRTAAPSASPRKSSVVSPHPTQGNHGTASVMQTKKPDGHAAEMGISIETSRTGRGDPARQRTQGVTPQQYH